MFRYYISVHSNLYTFFVSVLQMRTFLIRRHVPCFGITDVYIIIGRHILYFGFTEVNADNPLCFSITDVYILTLRRVLCFGITRVYILDF